MKMGLVTISLIGLLLLFTRDANAQVYDLYYYWDGSQYQQYWPQYDLYSYGNTNQYPEQLYDPYYSCTSYTISCIYRSIRHIHTDPAVLAGPASFQGEMSDQLLRLIGSVRHHRSVLCHDSSLRLHSYLDIKQG